MLLPIARLKNSSPRLTCLRLIGACVVMVLPNFLPKIQARRRELYESELVAPLRSGNIEPMAVFIGELLLPFPRSTVVSHRPRAGLGVVLAAFAC